MRTCYFFYQKTQSGQWYPTIQYDEPPRRKDGYIVGPNGVQSFTTEPVKFEMEPDMQADDQMFNKLQEIYPRTVL